MIDEKNILSVEEFNFIKPQDRAIFDAYLKRFTSIQDFLGAKIFPLLIEIREIRNELEHDYPDELQEALADLKYCIDNFTTLESYYFNVIKFTKRFQE